MRLSRRELLEHVAEIAAEGKFGDRITNSQRQYASLPSGLAVFLACVNDYCKQNTEMDQETRSFRDQICKLLVVAYREARRADANAAEPFLSSLIADYPGASESALLTRWLALTQACLALRELSGGSSRLLLWQQAEKTFVAYNEFLNGLLGYIIVLQRCQAGKVVNPGVFECAYGDKVNQLNTLTGGEDGAFYLFGRLARPSIRNAAAHGRLWLDPKRDTVRFVDGKGDKKKEAEIPLTEFMGLLHLGSHLGMPYLAAIGTLVVVEFGNDYAKNLLPRELVELWGFSAANDS